MNPSFNISLRAENAARPGVSSTVTVHGVKIDEWSYTLPEDDFVMVEDFRVVRRPNGFGRDPFADEPAGMPWPDVGDDYIPV